MGGCAAGPPRGQFADSRRQVGEEPSSQIDDFVLILCNTIDDAAIGMDLGPSELFLGLFLAEGALDQRRSADQDLGCLAGHESIVRSRQARRREAGDGAHRCRHDWGGA